MKINEKYSVRSSMGIDFTFAMGENNDKNTIVSYNSTALMLRRRLEGREFELQDVVDILLEEYEVDEATARSDADAWINQMMKLQFVIE